MAVIVWQTTGSGIQTVAPAVDGQLDLTFALTSSLNVSSITMEAGLATVGGGVLSKRAVEISLEGDLATISTITGGAEVLLLTGEGTMYSSKSYVGNAEVIKISMDGSGYVGQGTLSLDKELVLFSMEGEIVQAGDQALDPGDDLTYPGILLSGDEYIVVNLRTKSHSTYRDGTRAAVAASPEMTFDSYTEKSVSDFYLHARAEKNTNLVVLSGESKERIYPLTYGENTQANLKNRRKPLAKGVRATNWKFTIVVPEDSHMEIRGIDLRVHDLKRHS